MYLIKVFLNTRFEDISYLNTFKQVFVTTLYLGMCLMPNAVELGGRKDIYSSDPVRFSFEE